MKNSKWNTKSIDERPLHVVLFVSRNKDNHDIKDYKERRQSFITKEPINSQKLIHQFLDFANEGLEGETSRMYYSVNERNEEKIHKDLLHFLIDEPDFNLCSIQSKLAGIAAMNTNAKTKHWMFDFDIDDSQKVFDFCTDIKRIDPTCIVNHSKTPHGYAVVVNHGFDTRTLFEKWDEDKDNITLKRDDLLCYHWITKSEGENH